MLASSVAQHFNLMANNLSLLQSFIADIQSGEITLSTDGNGNYSANMKEYNATTGVPTNEVVPLNVTAIQSVGSAMATLGTLIAAATVVQSAVAEITPTPIGG